MKGWCKKSALLIAFRKRNRISWLLRQRNVGVPVDIELDSRADGFVRVILVDRTNQARSSCIVPIESVSFDHKLFKGSLPLAVYNEWQSFLAYVHQTREDSGETSNLTRVATRSYIHKIW